MYRTPCDLDLFKHYEEALASREKVDPALLKSYPIKVGKIVYAMPASRADCAYTVGMLTRCLTFPTEAMDKAADRCLAYMAQTADRGPRYGRTERSDANLELHAYTDSDWQVRSSTSA